MFGKALSGILRAGKHVQRTGKLQESSCSSKASALRAWPWLHFSTHSYSSSSNGNAILETRILGLPTCGSPEKNAMIIQNSDIISPRHIISKCTQCTHNVLTRDRSHSTLWFIGQAPRSSLVIPWRTSVLEWHSKNSLSLLRLTTFCDLPLPES